METWELAAREAIRDAIARYAHCADGGRFEELAGLFADDGVLEIGSEAPLEGRATIREFLGATKGRLASATVRPFIRHHVSSIRIDLEGPDAAGASSYFFVVTERGPDHWGRYRDRLVRAGDLWLFRHRRVTVDGRAAGSVFGG